MIHKSISRRLMFNGIIVASITTFLSLLVVMGLVAIGTLFTNADRTVALLSIIPWIYDTPPENLENWDMPPGMTLIVAPNEIIAYAENHLTCEVGMLLEVCAPELLNLSINEEVTLDNEVLITLETQTGHQVISQRKKATSEVYTLALFIPACLLTILSMPIAAITAVFTTRKLAQRLNAIVSANKRFADGDFSVRLDDSHTDDIGQISQQFNSMADVLEQNIHLLRDLAKHNAERVSEAENNAIKSERNRLVQNLHDSIAQQLFSLSLTSLNLPDIIEKDSALAIEQAKQIATLSSQANLQLRELLINLRPTDIVNKGLPDALKSYCNTWQHLNKIPLDCTLLLQGNYIPKYIEDVIYWITQEALSNIAKHAQPSSASVTLLEETQQLTLIITDDGKGFNPNNRINTNTNFGLVNIRERAKAVGGHLDISSSSEQGTTIKIDLPLRVEQQDYD